MEYSELLATLKDKLNLSKSFDIQCRVIISNGKEAAFFSTAGLIDSELAEELIEHLTRGGENAVFTLPCHDVTVSQDPDVLTDAVLSGRGVILSDGVKGGIIADIKKFPLRVINEP